MCQYKDRRLFSLLFLFCLWFGITQEGLLLYDLSLCAVRWSGWRSCVGASSRSLRRTASMPCTSLQAPGRWRQGCVGARGSLVSATRAKARRSRTVRVTRSSSLIPNMQVNRNPICAQWLCSDEDYLCSMIFNCYRVLRSGTQNIGG